MPVVAASLPWACSRAMPPAGIPEDGGAAVLAFHRRDAGGCEWTRWSPEGGVEVVGASGACPTQAVFDPDGSRVVYVADRVGAGDQAAHLSAWPALAAPTITLPLPRGGMRWQPLWVGDDGPWRLEGVGLPTESRRGDETVLTVGDLSTSVWKDPGGSPRWSIVEGRSVRPTAEAGVNGLFPPWGYLAVSARYAADGAGWTLVSALPTTLATDVVRQPTADPGAWPSLASTYVSCRDEQICEKPEWEARADLRGRFDPSHSIGFLPAGGGGWLFGVGMGDTLHAMGPVFSCADPECTDPLPLADLPAQDPYVIAPRGSLVLIGEEYTQADARVYRLGQARPVHAMRGAERTSWLPPGVGTPAPP